MKKVMTVALVLALVLTLSGSVMAAGIKENPEESGSEVEGLVQGAVRCLLVIDYTTPGIDATGTSGSGTMVLTAARDEQVETFTAEIPWGLTDEEAVVYIKSTFEPMVEEAFELQVNSFKVIEYEFNEETSVTTATLLAIHGKAPVRLVPPGKGKTVRSTEMFTHAERHAVKAKRK